MNGRYESASLDYNDSSVFARAIRDQRVSDEAFYVLVTLYALLIFFGTFGSLMVIAAVLHNPSMRTPRNYFILNLAVSDLLLCTFTMPFTFLEIVKKFWRYGSFMCKFVGSMQAISIFLSTMNITAIAVDRYQAVVTNAKMTVQGLKSFLSLFFIWVVAIFLSLPMALSRSTVSETVHVADHGLLHFVFCIEKWPTSNGRAYYSVFSMIFQYIIPVLIVSVSYTKICCKLQRRLSTNILNKKKKEDLRVRRTNLLLICISVIFGLCWIPLNLFNLLADCCYASYLNSHVEQRNIIFALCHMLGMSSACLNPVFYGWLNDNFKKEFKNMLHLEYFSYPRSANSTNENRSQKTESTYIKLQTSKTRCSRSFKEEFKGHTKSQNALRPDQSGVVETIVQKDGKFLETSL